MRLLRSGAKPFICNATVKNGLNDFAPLLKAARNAHETNRTLGCFGLLDAANLYSLLPTSWTSVVEVVFLLELSMENETKKARKYYPKKSIVVSDRDQLIEGFLDRVGWANYQQICNYLEPILGQAISPKNIQPRLSLLVKFERLRSARTSDTTYFALTRKSKRNNELVGDLRIDRLAHDNFLIDEIFLNYNFSTYYRYLLPREIRAQIKVGTKSGPIPDMILLDENLDDSIHIEYERTPKSTQDVKQSIYNWLWSPRRLRKNSGVVVICASDEIFNRYVKCLDNFKVCKTKNDKTFSNLRIISYSEDLVTVTMKIFITQKIDMDWIVESMNMISEENGQVSEQKEPQKD